MKAIAAMIWISLWGFILYIADFFWPDSFK